MLELKDENKELCFADSTLKPLKLYMYAWVNDKEHIDGGYYSLFTVIENSIVLESAQYTEGILDGNEFVLGSYVLPQMKVEWAYDGTRYNKCICVPVQQIGDEYISYLTGYVTEEKISADGLTVSAKIVTNIEEILKSDVVELLKVGYDVKISSFIERVLQERFGIYVDTALLNRNFINANLEIKGNTLDGTPMFNLEFFPKKMSGTQFLKNCAEFLGAQIKIPVKKTVNEAELNNAKILTHTQTIEFVRIPDTTLVGNITKREMNNGYKQTDYIEATGEQYIVLDYIPNQDTRIVCDYQYTNATNGFLFGSRKSVAEKTFEVNVENNGTKLYSGYGSSGNVEYGEIDLSRHTIDKNKNLLYFDGKLVLEQPYTNFVCPERLCLCACYSESDYGFGYLPCHAKIYSFKVYENDNLLYDLVPCENENGFVGMYDFVNNNFLSSSSLDEFISPTPTSSYVLPYYISLRYDKNDFIGFDGVSLEKNLSYFPKENERGTYIQYIKGQTVDNPKIYEINDNFFFNMFESDVIAQDALKNVGTYLASLKYYNCDLQYTYAPFIEPNDLIICKEVKGATKVALPNGYIALEFIELNSKSPFVDTWWIIPDQRDGSDIELEIRFSVYRSTIQTCIFEANGADLGYDTIALYKIGSELYGRFGYYGGSIRENFLSIDGVPDDTIIDFKLHCGNDNYQYSGTYNGTGEYNNTSQLYTKEPMILGDNSPQNAYKLYHFSFSQGGEKISDLYPCVRLSDNMTGMYDLARNEFIDLPNADKKSRDVALPVLNSNSKGIHSMKADVVVNSAINK